MTEAIRIFIPGIPVPKARPRFGRGRVFTPKKTRAYEDTIRLEATLAMKGRKPLAGPVYMLLTVYIRPPQKPKHDEPIGRPDIDNFIKSALDGCNGIVFADDAQVTRVDAMKMYFSSPGMAIVLEPA